MSDESPDLHVGEERKSFKTQIDACIYPYVSTLYIHVMYWVA
jgi:hypothetical protein